MGTGEMAAELQQDHWSMKMIRAMIWAGTREHHGMDASVRTPKQFGDLMNQVDDIQEVIQVVFEAYRAGQPGAQQADEPSENGEVSELPKQGKKTAEAKAKA